jgi:hypothetical protein
VSLSQAVEDAMTICATHLAGAAVLTVLAGLVPDTAIGQPAEPVANIGTLLCTVDPDSGKGDGGAERTISCAFEPISGPKARFTGTVKRRGADEPLEAKLVLGWSVMAPVVGTPAERLEGRYVGTLDPQRGTRAPALIGGVNSEIALRPLTDNVGTGGDSATVTVIELRLAAMPT